MDRDEDEGRLPDQRLKELLAKNLNEYFAQLVLAYQDKLMQHVCSIYDHRYAEDIVLETFINAHRALSKYSLEKIYELKLCPWLFKIAKNLALNHARKHKNNKNIALSLDLPEVRDLVEGAESGQHPSPEKEVEQGEARDELYRAIEQLPEGDRRIVEMYYFGELEYNQIAKMLKLKLNTVKSRGLRSLKRLRKVLEKEALTDGRA